MNISINNIEALLPDGVHGNCSVYIEGNSISGIGIPPESFRADKIIDGRGKLLIPGLINSHTHSYMTVFRNYADDLSFHDWLFGKILPMEDKLSGIDCYWGTLLGIMEMLSTGTSCFLDMYIFPNTVTEAVCQSGMRAVLSRGLTGGVTDVGGGERRIREAISDIESCAGNNRISFMLAPHAPYSCDEGYQREVAAAARELGVGIHTHLSESRRENDEILEKYGCTPTELMARTGLLTAGTVAAHCVHLTDGDIKIFRDRGISVATNPVSNLKLANGIAPVPELLEAGVNICIGTDGPASNNSLNMIREMGYAALLHKGVTGNPEMMGAEEVLKMATRNGAAALGLGDITGEIAVGKRADVTIIGLNKPNMLPHNSAVSALVYSANGSEVETTIVDGEILYDRGQFPTIDADRVIFEAENVCRKIGMRGEK